jgi:hypothetical protein
MLPQFRQVRGRQLFQQRLSPDGEINIHPAPILARGRPPHQLAFLQPVHQANRTVMP